jgi:hypothetical protein
MSASARHHPEPSKPLAPATQRSLELIRPVPSDSTLGRAILAAARREAPCSATRARILGNVLAALKSLTGST